MKNHSTTNVRIPAATQSEAHWWWNKASRVTIRSLMMTPLQKFRMV